MPDGGTGIERLDAAMSDGVIIESLGGYMRASVVCMHRVQRHAVAGWDSQPARDAWSKLAASMTEDSRR